MNIENFYDIIVDLYPDSRGWEHEGMHLVYKRTGFSDHDEMRKIDFYKLIKTTPEEIEMFTCYFGQPPFPVDEENHTVVFGVNSKEEVEKEQEHIKTVLKALDISKTSKDVEIHIGNNVALVHGTTQRQLREDEDFQRIYAELETSIRTHFLGETTQTPEGQTGAPPEKR